MRRLFVVTTMIVLLFWGFPALAQDGLHLQLGEEVLALRGAVAFCIEEPSRCEGHAETQAVLDQDHWRELVFVNKLVNTQIVFVSEPEGVDVWRDSMFLTKGDCEDYALVKRRYLIQMGWPAGALSMAIVQRKRDDEQLHAVLVARTNKGDFVLDSQVDEVKLWRDVRFHEWRMRQSAENPHTWYGIIVPSASVVGAK